MTLFDADSAGLPETPEDADEPPEDATGLPWLRTWPRVYLFVMGGFVTWVVLLVVLERVFS